MASLRRGSRGRPLGEELGGYGYLERRVLLRHGAIQMSEAGRAGGRTPPAEEQRRWSSVWIRGLVLVACLGVGLGLGLAYFKTTDPTFQATATVLVVPTSTGLDASVAATRASSEVNMDTEAEIARSVSVATAASATAGGDLSVEALLSDSKVTVPTNSQVLEFTVQAPTGELASDGANALAEAYLARRSEVAAGDIDSAKSQLDVLLKEANDQLTELRDQAAAGSAGPLTDDKIELVKDEISNLRKQRAALDLGATEGGQVISEAVPPEEPVAPKLVLSMAGGLVVGAALAALLALLGALRRPVSPQKSEQPSHGEVQVLASVTLPVDPAGPAPDEARLRRTCRAIASLPGDPGPITFVGGRDPVSGTAVALQLARAWASEFGEAAVVATDRAARDTLPAEARQRPGVVDLLLDGVPSGECATPLGSSTAVVVGPGSRHDIPDTVHAHHLMRVWDTLGHEFGTLLASATEHDSPLGAMTIQTAGRIVGVVFGDHMRDRDLRAIINALDSLSATERLVGVVVVEDGGSSASTSPPAPAERHSVGRTVGSAPEDPSPTVDARRRT